MSLSLMARRLIPRVSHVARYTPAPIRAMSSSAPMPPPQTPGAPDGTIPTAENQSVYLEYEEVQLAKEGRRRFNRGPWVGPFGTVKNPALVLSAEHSRIVGCTGGLDRKHDLSWFEVSEGKKHMCAECGQVFKLVHEVPKDQLYNTAEDLEE